MKNRRLACLHTSMAAALGLTSSNVCCSLLGLGKRMWLALWFCVSICLYRRGVGVPASRLTPRSAVKSASSLPKSCAGVRLRADSMQAAFGK